MIHRSRALDPGRATFFAVAGTAVLALAVGGLVAGCTAQNTPVPAVSGVQAVSGLSGVQAVSGLSGVQAASGLSGVQAVSAVSATPTTVSATTVSHEDRATAPGATAFPSTYRATPTPSSTRQATTRPRTTARSTPAVPSTKPVSSSPSARAPISSPAAPAPPARRFDYSETPIGAALAARMSSSWRTGCPVPLSDLTYLRMSFHGFDGKDHLGEMVVAKGVATQVVSVFRNLFDHRFPIRRMSLVDDFGGSDDASMAADNTSAFNCRPITGGTSYSQHSYGEAIDVDPVENPYVGDGQVLPPAGNAFVDRPDSPGVLHDGDDAVAAFASIGWSWGGDWSSPQDFQHFSANGK